MPTLTEYFETESRIYLEQLRELVARERPETDPLYRTARSLRGSAQMAREERVYRAALALETVGRALLAGTLSWSDELNARLREAVTDLEALVAHTEMESALDARLAQALERWRAVGVPLPGAALGHSPEAAAAAQSSTAEFRTFAAREVEAIADALEQGVGELSGDPMNREVLKAILRRQRALLGAARLDEIPVVAEILRAIEDLTRVIAKLDVGVKQEWLDVFRVARDGLRATLEPLRADRNPNATHALARLRHLRAELLDRYGTGEAVSAAAGAGEGLAQAQSMPDVETAQAAAELEPPPPPAQEVGEEVAAEQSEAAAGGAVEVEAEAEAQAEEVVPIETLEYRGEAALRRALELRPSLEAALRGRTAHLETLDELFDLIRLALD